MSEYNVGDRVIITKQIETRPYNKGDTGTVIEEMEWSFLVRFDNGKENCVAPQRMGRLESSIAEDMKAMKDLADSFFNKYAPEES